MALGALVAVGALLIDVGDPVDVVDTMHERKARMYEASDAFLTLPGGFGTLDETLEVITWRQLALHDKPVVFVGGQPVWGGLAQTFDVMHANGFLSDRDRSLVRFEDSAEAAVAGLAATALPSRL